jgi:hypothetical protein
MPQPSSLPPIQPGPPLNPQIPAYIPAEPVRNANVWAITSIIAGLLGWLPFVPGAIAVVTGILGVRRARDERYTGRGLAVAGLLLGVASLVAWSLGGPGLATSTWEFVSGRTTREPLRVADAFLDALGDGDVPGALAHTGPAVPHAQVQQWAETAQPWGTFTGLTAFDRSVETHAGVSVARFEGTAEFASETRAVAIVLVKEDEAWKVTDVQFP